MYILPNTKQGGDATGSLKALAWPNNQYMLPYQVDSKSKSDLKCELV